MNAALLIIASVVFATRATCSDVLRDRAELAGSDLVHIWIDQDAYSDLMRRRQSVIDCRPLFNVYKWLADVPNSKRWVVVNEGDNLLIKVTQVLDDLTFFVADRHILTGSLRIRLISPSFVRTASMIYVADKARDEKVVRGRIIQILPEGEPTVFPADEKYLDPASKFVK